MYCLTGSLGLSGAAGSVVRQPLSYTPERHAMDQLPSIGRDLMWCFTLGDPDAEALSLFGQLAESGNLDWVLVVVRNPGLDTLRAAPLAVAYGG